MSSPAKVAPSVNDSRSLVIAFVYTFFQKAIIKAVAKKMQKEVFFIYPSHRSYLKTESTSIVLSESDLNISPKKAFALRKNITSLIRELTKGTDFEVWLASCDNPIGQLLVNHKKCARKVLFEDGIGSYVKNLPFDCDKGVRSILRKIKYFIYFFPEYRSVYGLGSLSAHEYWAIFSSAFPRSKKKPNIINAKDIGCQFDILDKLPEIKNLDLVYIDQPLERIGVPKHLIKKSLGSYIGSKKEFGIIWIKKHPVTNDIEINEIVELFSSLTDHEIRIIDQNIPIESLCVDERFKPFQVFSFLSTALYTIKALRNDVSLISIKGPEIVRKHPRLNLYYKALRSIGVEVRIH